MIRAKKETRYYEDGKLVRVEIEYEETPPPGGGFLPVVGPTWRYDGGYVPPQPVWCDTRTGSIRSDSKPYVMLNWSNG